MSASSHASPSSRPAEPKAAIAEVKYSLPDLLAEIELERAESALGMERLSPADIQKHFKSVAKRRGKKSR